MALAEHRVSRSEKAAQEAGLMALIQSLGYAHALRFVEQLSAGQGNDVEWQDRVFGDASVDEIYERAQADWEARKRDNKPAQT